MTEEAVTGDRPKKLALHWKIGIGLLVGMVAGLIANAWFPADAEGKPHDQLKWAVDNFIEPVGKIFLRIIFMVVIPLVVSALILGVAGIGNVGKLGRTGIVTLLLTLVLSATAVVIGVMLVNTMQPGRRLTEEQRTELNAEFASAAEARVQQANKAKSFRDTMLDLIPNNPLQEMVGAVDGSSPGGGMLAVMVFSLFVGVAIAAVPEKTGPLVSVIEGIYAVSMTIIGFAMKLAPYGVAALVFAMTALLGIDVFRTLLWFFLTVVTGLLIQLVVVYSLVLFFGAKMRPWDFFSRISEAMLTAFATSSSNASLPTTLRVADSRLGLRPEISRFVLTVGATGNQNGTAFYEGVTVLFLAQAFGIDLTVGQQVQVVLMSILAGVGTAGVPGGSLPMIVLVMQSVGIPGEGIGVILGVDRLLDMCRTTLNVTGDLVIATTVNRFAESEAAEA